MELTLANLVLCFLCLSPETSKNAEGIGNVLFYFCRELVLVRKSNNTSPNPRNEGFTWRGCFIGFRLKNCLPIIYIIRVILLVV